MAALVRVVAFKNALLDFFMSWCIDGASIDKFDLRKLLEISLLCFDVTLFFLFNKCKYFVE